MTLEVAIASEQDAYDGEIYRLLVERLLGRPVVRWTGPFVFSGCKSVAKMCDAFLNAASAAGIRHALLAVDNDGGARRRPEHEATHAPVPFNLNDDGCRERWLTSAIPPSWAAGDLRLCVVVPVQVIETWLLVLRGHAFASPTPEQRYDRAALKKDFFGKPIPSLATRIALAQALVARPDSIDVLRARPSFQRFADRVRDW